MANITSYLNVSSDNLEKQLDLANELGLKQVVLVSKTKDTNEFNQISNKLKKSKSKIYLLDFVEKQYNISNQFAHDARIDEYDNLLSKISKLPIEFVSLYLPIVNNLNNEKDLLIEMIKNYEKIAIKHKIKFMIMADKFNQPTLTAYIFKQKIDKKRFGLVFEPNVIVESGYPISTAYRLLKNEIELLVVDDYIGERPVLVGKGNLDYFGLFKKFIRDHYQRGVIIPTYFTKFMVNYRNKKIKALFSKKERDLSQVYQWSFNQIKSNKVIDVINYQLNLLKLIFEKK